MLSHPSNGFITILSGIAGGLSKAYFLSIVLIQVDFSTILSVIAYAALSAVVGYVVKILLDIIRKTIQNICKLTKKNKYE